MNEKSVFLDILKIILLIIFPPIGVYFCVGFGVQFWINLLLTIFGYFPGLIHGIYLTQHPEMHEK
jgi:uncharacterized membrane protein YqaE (UPF0057 family)